MTTDVPYELALQVEGVGENTKLKEEENQSILSGLDSDSSAESSSLEDNTDRDNSSSRERKVAEDGEISEKEEGEAEEEGVIDPADCDEETAAGPLKTRNEIVELPKIVPFEISSLPADVQFGIVGKIASCVDEQIIVEAIGSGEELVLDSETALFILAEVVNNVTEEAVNNTPAAEELIKVDSKAEETTSTEFSVIVPPAGTGKAIKDPLAELTVKVNDAQEIVKEGQDKSFTDAAEESVSQTEKTITDTLAGGELNIKKDSNAQKMNSLGRVWDVFGPVSQPFYSIRFNTSAEAKTTFENLTKGQHVFYVPNLSNTVLTKPLKQMKGTDASNFFDEEIGVDELEFSDDEKEQEFKKGLKRKKNGQDCLSPKKRSQTEYQGNHFENKSSNSSSNNNSKPISKWPPDQQVHQQVKLPYPEFNSRKIKHLQAIPQVNPYLPTSTLSIPDAELNNVPYHIRISQESQLAKLASIMKGCF